MHYLIHDLSLFSIGDPITRLASPGEASLDHILPGSHRANGDARSYAPLQADAFVLDFSLSARSAGGDAERLARLCGLEVSFTGEGPGQGTHCTGHGTLEQLERTPADAGRLRFAVVMARDDLLVEPPSPVPAAR